MNRCHNTTFWLFCRSVLSCSNHGFIMCIKFHRVSQYTKLQYSADVAYDTKNFVYPTRISRVDFLSGRFKTAFQCVTAGLWYYDERRFVAKYVESATTIFYLPHRKWWRLFFRPVFARVGRYIEQLSGANSSPIVTKLRQSYPWSQGTRWLNFGKLRSKVKVGGEGMRSTERPSS